ncbi:MAG: hypothetical protein ABIK65_05295 [Candidatus Eisenbacteria bacterium]
MRFPRVPQQLIPLCLLFAVLIVAIVVARSFLVPPTFGERGYYRWNAVEEIRELGTSYAGYVVCAECHDDIAEAKGKANHRGLSCESCHGPAADHAEAPDEFLPEKPAGREFCALCHGYNAARPSGFPQIIPDRHHPGEPCVVCHDPHAPALPNLPDDCGACHRKIASQKSVSHHVGLSCLDCHDVLEEHVTSPSPASASKPTSRARCGRCHAEGADSPKIVPRVDLDTHGGRYLCWDCHYPHHPEASR